MNINILKIRNIINVAILLIVVSLASVSPVLATSDAKKGLNQAASKGYTGNAGTADITSDNVITSIPKAIGKLIGVVLQFVGLAFFVLMIYGGFIWMFARGNDQDVQKAKDLITAAVIGLIIVLSAYAITVFIGNALIGSESEEAVDTPTGF